MWGCETSLGGFCLKRGFFPLPIKYKVILLPIRMRKLVSLGGAFFVYCLSSRVFESYSGGGYLCELCLGLYFVGGGRATFRVNLLPPSSLLEA